MKGGQITMKEAAPRTTCPDCEAALQPIKLIDHTRSVIDTELSYTAGDARQGWFGGFPVAGTVQAKMCSQCGRILLYGEASPEA
jgi:RNase P subunit RPR2